MDEKAFSEAVDLLSGEHSLPILRYLATGEWRIATDVSRALDIHTTTASKFLSGMHALGFLEGRVRKSRTRSASEYRLSTPRLALDLELASGPAPLQGAMDFYLEYVSKVLEKSRRLGWPGIAEKLEARLEKTRNGFKERFFTCLPDGSAASGVDDLRTLLREIHREFLEIMSESMGRPTARRLLQGAADEARRGRMELVDRYELRKALEA